MVIFCIHIIISITCPTQVSIPSSSSFLSILHNIITVDYVFLQKQKTDNNELGPPVVIADPNFDLGMHEGREEGWERAHTGEG